MSIFDLYLSLSFPFSILNHTGKLSHDQISGKWTGSGGDSSVNLILQNSINNGNNSTPNNSHLANKQTNLNNGLNSHHHHHHHPTSHHHHALSAAALSSPFSSLLSATGSAAGYLLDPLGSLSKPTTANHLF